MSKTTKYAAKQPDAQGFIPYSDAEHAVWRDLYARQSFSIEQHCAQPFLAGFARMKLPSDKVP